MYFKAERQRRLGGSVLAILLAVCIGVAVPSVSMGGYVPEGVGTRGLVASAHSYATLAGLEVLKRGGNAFDAAVAVNAVISVVEPYRSGLGGVGFMTLYVAKTGGVVSLQMTGAAPYAATPDRFQSKRDQEVGYLAGVVPGVFGGWVYLLEKYGTMKLSEVLEPAIYYAEKGFPINKTMQGVIKGVKSTMAIFPEAAEIYLPNGKVPEVGDILVQKNLADTLKRLAAAETGALKAGKSREQALMAAYDLFYKGEIAQEMADFYKNNDGLFTVKDFADYKPVFGKPVHVKYRGMDIYSNNAPSRGGIQGLMILNMLEGYDLKKMGHNSPEYLHLITEIIKIVNADLYKYLGDPKFVRIPVAGLLSKEYAAERRNLIDMKKAAKKVTPGNPWAYQKEKAAAAPMMQMADATAISYKDDGNTTHFDVVDKDGNAVGCTPTIGTFGTKVVVGKTGMIFHNATRFGSFSPYKGDANFIDGGKTSLLNNSAMIALKDGKPFMVWGTPGGEGIGQTQFQVFLNVVEFGMGIQDAIEAVRVQLVAKPDFYRPEEISGRYETRLTKDVKSALEAKGNKVIFFKEAFAETLGGMQGIIIDLQTGVLTGGADPRRGGVAIGF